MKYVAVVLLCLAGTAGAITNPDAPDLVAAFHERMAPYAQRIRDGQTTLAMDQASVAMAEALDRELNTAYGRLMARLEPAQQSALRTAQRRWLKYRAAEFAFLNKTFSRESHGSAVVLTVGSARNALVQARVEALWRRLQQL